MARGRGTMHRSFGLAGFLAIILIVGSQVLGTAMPRSGAAGNVPAPMGSAAAPWAAPLREAEEGLAHGDARAADRAWRAAYRVALASRRWEGMLEAGDVRLRLGQTAPGGEDPRTSARRLYLAGFLWARDQRSLEGVLRAAEAFAALGDREVVEHVLHIADEIVARSGDAQGQERLGALRQRWAAHPLQADGQGVGRL